MKKVVAIIAVIVAFAAVAVGVLMYRQGKTPGEMVKMLTTVTPTVPEKTLATVVPQDAVAYMGIYDLKNHWKLFTKSKTWKAITGLRLWEDLDFNTALATFQEQFKEQAGIELNEATIMEFFGRQFAVALFMKNDRQNEPSLMILAQVGAKTRILSGLIGLAQQTDSQFTTIEYNGVKIYHVAPTPETPTAMSYALAGDILILEVGQSVKNINAVIDMVKQGSRKGALSELVQFKDVTDANNGPFFQELFVNSAEIIAKMDQTALPEAFQDETVRNSLRSSLATISVLGGASRFNNGLYSRLMVIPNYQTDNEALRKLWAAAPEKSKAMRLIPKDSILFNSSQSLDIPALWNVWQESVITQDVDQANAIMTSISALETSLAISLKNDVFPVLGSEVAYVLSDLSIEGFLPIPKAGIILSVKDSAQANTLMSKVIQSINNYYSAANPEGLPMLTVETSSFMDVPIVQAKITTLPIAGLTPSYMVIDDQLVIATNSMMLQDMVRVARGKDASLSKSDNYNRVKDVITDRNNQVSYINVEMTVTKLIDICQWLIDLQRSVGEAGALDQDTLNLITDNLIPFIRTFNSIKALAANTVYTKTGIEKTIVYRVEDF
ncbi:MAG: hypothetical protein RBU23_01360 [Candidatus Auribacterota bacterium]|jgi:hypothetical protein|nr:hypothetical protein [Candidatus Auribacterota bacterium]